MIMTEQTTAGAAGRKASQAPQAGATRARATNKDGSPRKKAEPVQRTPVDFSKLTVSAVTERTEMAKYRRTKTERDAEQKALDDLVVKAHKRWEESGRPDNWLQSPGLKLRIPTDQVDTLKFRLRKSALYYGMALRFGATVSSGDGFSEVVFIAKDPNEKDRAEAEAEVNDSGDTAGSADERSE